MASLVWSPSALYQEQRSDVGQEEYEELPCPETRALAHSAKQHLLLLLILERHKGKFTVKNH